MKNTVFLSVLFSFFIFPLFGQEIAVTGFVTDSITGEPLIGVNIFEPSKKGATTNEYGYFYLKTSATVDAVVIFSHIGYRPKTVRVTSGSFLYIHLTQGVEKLSEVSVTAKRNHEQQGRQSLTPELIKPIPSLLGEPDVLKALMFLPGVTMGNEGTADLHVRGGSSDQNLFLLDDIQLYHVSHLGGFMSAFDANIIKQVDLYKGNFPARFGGRLSSVVDVHLKDGNKDLINGELMLGTLASKVYVEGPVGDKTTFLGSVRRCNFDLFTRLVANTGYTFYDFNGKITHRLNEKNKIYVISYLGRDKVFDKRENSKFAITWGNYTGAVKWNRVLMPNLFSNVMASYTHYFNNTNYKYVTDIYNSKSSIQSKMNDLSCKFNFSHFRDHSNYTFGGEAVYHSFTPHLMSYKGSDTDTIFSSKNHAFEYNIYSDIRINPLKFLNIDLGLRWSLWNMNKYSNYFQPRINLSSNITEHFTVSASFSRMAQFVHMLTVSGAGIPSNLWISSSEALPPGTSSQWSLGAAYSLKNTCIDIKVDAYTKRMRNLIHLKDGVIVQPGIDMESIISGNGKGEAKGIEFLLEKKTGKLTGWLGYTLSKNERTFENINNGKTFPDVYDRTHDFSIVASYSLSKIIKFSATWVCASGRLTTLPVQKYNIIDFTYVTHTREESLLDWAMNEIHVYGQKNGFRFPLYHRLDVGFSHTKEKKNKKKIWNIGLYNAYNRQNPYYYYIDRKTNKLYQVSIFPIIPSIAYSFIF